MSRSRAVQPGAPIPVFALRNIVREGRRSDGWASRPAGVPKSTIRRLLALGAIEAKEGTFPVYRVTAAGHQEIALADAKGGPE